MLAFVIGVAIVVGLAVSIGLHEIGHLVPAKLFGVKVTQYMIGFGPTIWSKRKGETEYGVKAIPLGGYIAMIGMFPPARAARWRTARGFFRTLVQDARDSSAESITTGDEHRAFYRLPVWKRIVVMFGGPFMNLLLAIVLFAVLLMGFGISQPSTTIGRSPMRAARDERAPDVRVRRPGGARRRGGPPAGRHDPGGRRRAHRVVERVDRDHPRPPGETIDMVVLRDGDEVRPRGHAAAQRAVRHRRAGHGRDGCRGRAGHGPGRVRRHRAGIRDGAPAGDRRAAQVGANVQAVAGIILNLRSGSSTSPRPRSDPRSATRTGPSRSSAWGAWRARSRASTRCRSRRRPRASSGSSRR